MFFQVNNTGVSQSSFSTSLNEVSTETLQNTPAENKKKSWIAIAVLCLIAWAVAPKSQSKNKFNKSYKRK